MLSEDERQFHSRRLTRRRAAGFLIIGHALAYYTGHVVGRGLGAINELAHRPRKSFNLFGG